MMYCPRCNNTHWEPVEPRNFLDRLAILRLQRPYRCEKCDRVRLGWIFLDSNSKPRKPRRKIPFATLRVEDMRCPECGGGVRRSRRNGLERWLIFIRVYRCMECRNRFRTLKVG
jgi:hypothetical protein